MPAYTGDTKPLRRDWRYWYAMARKGITIKGDKELRAAFKRLSAAARGPALIIAAKAGILPIQNAAISNAPYVSGELSRSIHTEVVEEKDESAFVTTGTDKEYAARVEFGFNEVDSLGRSYHQPAKPYMRPAYDEQRENAINEVEDALRDIIEAAAYR